jgi:hypothetical protein
MCHPSQVFYRLFVTFIVGWFCILSCVHNAAAQSTNDAVEKVLSSDSFPWYDASSQRVKPLPFAGRPKSRTDGRDQIPPYVPRNPGGNPGAAAAAEGLSWIFWIGLAIALAGIFAILVWAFLKLEAKNRQSSAATSRRSLAQSIEQLPFQIDTETGDFQSLAKRAYEAGNYRQATILLFSHILVTLDQANLIRLRKGKTNRQYLNELLNRATLSEFFLGVMESFESVFFGDHDISRTDFELSWNRLPEFTNAVNDSLSQTERATA